MRRCVRCGGRARRIHRTFRERFAYMAIYQCRQCHDISTLPRRYRFHLGERCRCPKCGTYHISQLSEPDRIDPFQKGFLNWLERIAGGRLFHCKFCRLQFYDRRKTPSELARQKAQPEDVSANR